MEFLVRSENKLPLDTPEHVQQQLRTEERQRAQELRDAGVLRRLWRVPGRNAAVGLYEAADATELHAALASLPMWKWMDISIEPLATHPQEMSPS